MLNFIYLLFLGTFIGYIFTMYERYKRKKTNPCKDIISLKQIYNNFFLDTNINYKEFVDLWKYISNTLKIDEKCLDANKKLRDYSTHTKISISTDIDIFEDKLYNIENLSNDITIKDLLLLLKSQKIGEK